jgi:hypothetical protein
VSHEDIFALNKARIARFEKVEGHPWGVEGAVMELAAGTAERSHFQ